ncbi:MAG: hypothetical protein ABW221_05380 [Vicinamibacteria bacterium]
MTGTIGQRVARVTRTGALLASMAFLAACGGGGGAQGASGAGNSVLGASTNAQAPVLVLSMSNDAPVSGLAAPSLAPGDQVRLSAPGYLGLEETYRGGNLYMMDADEASVAAALYPQGRLLRLADNIRTVSLSPSAELAADPRTMAGLQAAVDVVNAYHPRVRFVLGGGGQIDVPVRVEAETPGFQNRTASALTYTNYDGRGFITGARIALPSVRWDAWFGNDQGFATALAHELLHVTGMAHLRAGESGLMSGSALMYQHREPTGQELVLMKAHYLRAAGTMLAAGVEREGAVRSASTGGGQMTFVESVR